MQKLLIGTQNQGKLKEYRKLLADLDLEIVGLGEVGLGDMDIEETGTTFIENALLKARAYAKESGLIALADDSGLEVDALDGRPGLYSARYAGKGATDADRRQKLLGELENVNERGAQFICVVAVSHPSGEAIRSEGIVRGNILREEKSDGHGFGYDAIFKPEGYNRSFAQISPEEKDALSHRGRAVQAILPDLEKFIK